MAISCRSIQSSFGRGSSTSGSGRALADFETVAALIETLEGSAELSFRGRRGSGRSSRGFAYTRKADENIKKVAIRIKAIHIIDRACYGGVLEKGRLGRPQAGIVQSLQDAYPFRDQCFARKHRRSDAQH